MSEDRGPRVFLIIESLVIQVINLLESSFDRICTLFLKGMLLSMLMFSLFEYGTESK
jgi:hypothetical protein